MTVLILLGALLAAGTDAKSPVKNVVLVHGAWADGSSWAKVIPFLEAAGLHAVAVQNPLTSLQDDVAATQRAIALQDGPVRRKIRVNVVSPGAIDTPGLQGLAKKDSAGLNELFRGRAPLERIGHVEDVANAVAFLASDESSYITGIELFVDGGFAQV